MKKTADFSYLILLLLSLAFFPFTTCEKNIQKEDQVSNESEEPDIKLPAMYTGTLPCADCPGINYRLIIENDRFTEISIYQDRSPGRFEETGNWQMRGDTLKLLQPDSTISKKFLLDQQKVTLLDADNQQITGDLADHYVLERTGDQRSIREHHQNLADRGFTFFANGNEPFWSVKIDSTNHIIFETPDTAQTFGSMDSTQANDSILLKAQTGSNQITVNASQIYCQDSMSGYLFPQTVTVYLQSAKTDTLTGCGLFLNR